MSNYWEREEDEEEEALERTQPLRRARRREEAQSNLYLLTGLLLGLGIGLLIAWVISPVQFVDTGPEALNAADKDAHRLLIAMAYNANRNLERARERMRLVDGEQIVPALASQAQRMLAAGQPASQARAIAVLAADLSRPSAPIGAAPTLAGVASITASAASGALPGQPSSTPAAPLVEEGTPAIGAVQTPTLPPPTATATPTRTPRPTFTPTATPTPLRPLDAPFLLKNREEICDGSIQPGMIQIMVNGADGRPLPGVRIQVTSRDGTETFFTGLAPEISPGYADFQMTTGILYRLEVGDASEPLDGLKSSSTCGWKLQFTQQTGQ